MTKAGRATLRGLEAKATPGPWESVEQSGGDEWAIIGPVGTNPGYPKEGLVVATWCDDSDGGLVAGVRNSLVALLDALDDAEAVIDSLRSARVRARMRFGDQSERDPVEDALDAYDAKHGGGE